MKPLITVLSLALGLAALTLVFSIQNDRFTLTSCEPLRPTAAPESLVTVRTEPEPVLIELPKQTVDDAVWLEAVEVHAAPARRVPKPAAKPAAPEVEVIPAPCVEGEYRLLEPGRGVRLSCPASVPNS
jgi:hypothetical protein